MNSKLAASLKYIIGIGLGIFLFYYAFRDTSVSKLQTYFESASWGWLAFSMGFSVLSHLIRSLRWQMQLQAAGYKVSPLTAFSAVMFNYLVNFAFPRAGEVARCTALYQSDKVPVTISIGTVFTERLIDVLMLGILFVISFFLATPQLMDFWHTISQGKNEGPNVLLWGAVITGVVVAVIGWVFRKKMMEIPVVRKIYEFGMQMLESVLSIRKLKKPGLFIFYTLMIWTCYWMMMYVGLFCFAPIAELSGTTNLLRFAFIGTVIGSVGMALPIPGGIGPYHNAIIFAFVAFHLFPDDGMSRTMGQTFAFAFHTAQMLIMIAGGILGYVYLLSKNRNPK